MVFSVEELSNIAGPDCCSSLLSTPQKGEKKFICWFCHFNGLTFFFKFHRFINIICFANPHLMVIVLKVTQIGTCSTQMKIRNSEGSNIHFKTSNVCFKKFSLVNLVKISDL